MKEAPGGVLCWSHLDPSRLGKLIIPGMLLGAFVAASTPAAAFSRDPARVFVEGTHYGSCGQDRKEAVEIAGPAEADLLASAHP